MNPFFKHSAKPLFLIFLAFPIFSNAQAKNTLTDLLRQDGKIWVVIAVISIIFAGLIYYLFKMNQRINNIMKRK